MTAPAGSTADVALHGWTSDRMLAWGIVVGISLWTAAALMLATPGRLDRNGTLKGIDFSAVWLSGRLVATDRAEDLYDWHAWARHFPETFPDAPGLIFYPYYPPMAGLAFAPFGTLPFGQAVALWTLVSVVLYAGSCCAVWRYCPHLAASRSAALALVAACPALFLLLLNGQTTGLVLACFAAAGVAYHRGREFAMGLALGLAAIKPHFLIVPAMVLSLSGSWRALGGMAVSGVLQLALVAWALGPDVIVEFIRSADTMVGHLEVLEPRRWQAHGLKNALDLLLGTGVASTAMLVVLSVPLLVMAVRAWTAASAPRDLRFALLVLVSAVLNPHLYGYDLVVLVPVALLIADWLVSHPGHPSFRPMAFLLAAVYMMPLLAPVAAFTRIQVTPVLMILLFWLLAGVVSERGPVLGASVKVNG